MFKNSYAIDNDLLLNNKVIYIVSILLNLLIFQLENDYFNPKGYFYILKLFLSYIFFLMNGFLFGFHANFVNFTYGKNYYNYLVSFLLG